MHSSSCFEVGVQVEMDGTSYIVISLRLPFGGKPCSSDFCILSDIIADLTNDLMMDPTWKPEKIHSEYIFKIPLPKKLAEDIPFAQAMDLSVDLNEVNECKSDVFIDDLISLAVDIGNNLQRLIAAPCTVMHALAHKADGSTFLPRDNFIADDKNDAEGDIEESKIVL